MLVGFYAPLFCGCVTHFSVRYAMEHLWNLYQPVLVLNRQYLRNRSKQQLIL